MYGRRIPYLLGVRTNRATTKSNAGYPHSTTGSKQRPLVSSRETNTVYADVAHPWFASSSQKKTKKNAFRKKDKSANTNRSRLLHPTGTYFFGVKYIFFRRGGHLDKSSIADDAPGQRRVVQSARLGALFRAGKGCLDHHEAKRGVGRSTGGGWRGGG